MTVPETRYTRTVDGIRIAYQFIPGRDPVIFDAPIFAYQFGPAEDIASWVEYREALRGDNAWAILDFRGFGQSGPHEFPAAISDFALDLKAVASDLGERDLILVATAAGIGPALEFERQTEAHIRGLLLQAPSREGFDPLLLDLFRQDLERGLHMSARFMYDWESEDAIRPLVKKWMERLSIDRFWEAIDAYQRWDLEAHLKTASPPIVMTGPVELQEELAELAADLADARVSVDEVGPVLNARLGRYMRSLIEPWLGASPSRAVAPDGLESLTDRQREVLRLVAAGMTNAAIADELSIAPGTVARHVSDILGATGLSNRTEAARFAGQSGLID